MGRRLPRVPAKINAVSLERTHGGARYVPDGARHTHIGGTRCESAAISRQSESNSIEKKPFTYLTTRAGFAVSLLAIAVSFLTIAVSLLAIVVVVVAALAIDVVVVIAVAAAEIRKGLLRKCISN